MNHECQRPVGVGFRSVNPALKEYKNLYGATALSGFSFHLLAGFTDLKPALQKSFTVEDISSCWVSHSGVFPSQQVTVPSSQDKSAVCSDFHQLNAESLMSSQDTAKSEGVCCIGNGYQIDLDQYNNQNFEIHNPLSNLQSHPASCSEKKNIKVSSQTCYQRQFFCEICQHSFSRKSALKTHMRIHTGEEPYKCPLCEKCFKSHSPRKYHMCRQHGIDADNYLARIKLSSQACSQSVTENIGLLQPCSQRKFICEICRRPFSQKGVLKRHMRIHTAEEPYKCPLCDRHFKSHAPRKYHMCKQHGVDEADYLDYIHNDNHWKFLSFYYGVVAISIWWSDIDGLVQDIRIMHELPWITIFGSRVRRFANDFHEWRSHEWKSLANRITSDPKIVIHGNECIILFLTRYSMSWNTILLKTIIDRSFRNCRQGWHFLTSHCDVITVDLWHHANARY